MGKIIRIIEINNRIEADLLSKIFENDNIPYYIKTIEETAHDGIYELQKGFGFIEAPEEYAKKIKVIVNEFRDNKGI